MCSDFKQEKSDLEQMCSDLKQEKSDWKQEKSDLECKVNEFTYPLQQTSATTSKEQKKHVTWENVLAGRESIQDKPGVAERLSDIYEPLFFVSRGEAAQELAREYAGITGWNFKLCEHNY